MDIMTLSIVLFFVSFFQLIILGSQYLSNRHIQGLGWWTIGTGALVFVYVGGIFRAHPVLAPYAILLTNFSFLLGTIGYYVGIKRFFDLNVNLKPFYGFALLYVLFFVYFTIIVDEITLRRILNGLTGLVFSALMIRILWSQRHSYYQRILFYLILASLINLGFFCVRLLVNLIGPAQLMQIENLYLQPIAFMLSSTVGLFISFGMVFLVNQRVRRDYIRTQEQFEHVFNHNPGPVLITRMEDGVVVNVNQAFSEVTGYPREHVLGKSTIELQIWENPTIRSQFVQCIQKNGSCEHFEMKCKTADCQYIDVILSASSVNINEVTHLLIVATDITKHKQLTEKLACSEIRYRLLAEHSHDVIWTMNFEGIYTYVSPAIKKMTGFGVNDLVGRCWKDFLDESSYPVMEKALQGIYLEFDVGFAKEVKYYELKQKTIDGNCVWVEATIMVMSNENGAILGISGVSRDISERKKNELILAESQKKLAELSVKDELTSLFNRRKFNEVLDMEFSRHVRSKEPFSMVFLDIDFFKEFNDCYGHLKGDECLVCVAQVLAESGHRVTDLVARYGGEEFALILPETRARGALLVGERIRQAILDLKIPHERSKVADVVSVSMGILTVDCSKYECALEVLAQVDQLLYQAKAQGRNQCVSYVDPESELNVKQIVEIKWRRSYQSGNPVIDQQHRELFNLANRLLRVQIHGDAKEEVVQVLGLIKEHIILHFETEEQILADIHYLGLVEHCQEHQEIIKTLQLIIEQYDLGEIVIESVTHKLIYQIILKHLLGSDRAFFELMQ